MQMGAKTTVTALPMLMQATGVRLRPNKLLYSIRWRFIIIYLVLVTAVFGIISVAVSSLVWDYLSKQRIDAMERDVTSIAVQVAPYLRQNDASEMYNIVSESSKNLGGRILVLSDSGIVQTDSFSELNGVRRTEKEVNDILYGRNSASHGFHKVYDSSYSDGYFWSLYCTTGVISNGRMIGVVLYSASIDDVVQETQKLNVQLLWIYLLASVIIFVSSMIMTDFVTKPVRALTNVAMKISSGDLASRAEIKGKNEMAELGQTFNMMCDRLQNVDKQRSEFVSDASHELKTPLASMKILVESLLYQDNVEAQVYKEFLSDINSEIDRLNSLITDLLLLSKMDDGDVPLLNLEKTGLMPIVEKCVNSLQPIAERKNIAIKLRQGDSFNIECDPLKLRQAINNLIENAIKYTMDGGQVVVFVQRVGSEAHVVVEDNGVGMGREHLAHIFERFYRVDKARSRETGGTGLGLYIVRRIALMHGGRVEVESTEGKGSRFVLILPLNQGKTVGGIEGEKGH